MAFLGQADVVPTLGALVNAALLCSLQWPSFDSPIICEILLGEVQLLRFLHRIPPLTVMVAHKRLSDDRPFPAII